MPGIKFPRCINLTGDPMGGWIQYSLSPTTSAWLAQYFYEEWKFGHDTCFLRKTGYPYLHEVAVFLDNLSIKEGGKKKLPFSSSPEMGDNSIIAWHKQSLILTWPLFDQSILKHMKWQDLSEKTMMPGTGYGICRHGQI